MINNGCGVRSENLAAPARFAPGKNWICGLIILLLVLGAAQGRAADPEDLYLKIESIVSQADSQAAKGDAPAAKARYQDAQKALLNLKQTNPGWNPKVVSFRLGWLSEKITGLSAPAATTDSTTTTGSETKSDSPPAKSLVRLLSAGAEPRKVLRLAVKPEAKQLVEMTLKMTMDMGMGQPMKLPPMKMNMDVAVKEVSPEGDISYEVVVGDVSTAEEAGTLAQAADAMKAALDKIKGVSTTGTISSRGLSKTTEVKIPSDADPMTRQSMEQMKDSLAQAACPLPEEAVGPGAKWELKSPIKSQGMTMNQTATYELVSVDGDRLNLKSAITQDATNQKIENPAMPGIKVDVTKFTGSGTGQVTLDLAQLMPALATADMRSEMSMGIDLGGQKQNMTMKMDLSLRMEAK